MPPPSATARVVRMDSSGVYRLTKEPPTLNQSSNSNSNSLSLSSNAVIPLNSVSNPQTNSLSNSNSMGNSNSNTNANTNTNANGNGNGNSSSDSSHSDARLGDSQANLGVTPPMNSYSLVSLRKRYVPEFADPFTEKEYQQYFYRRFHANIRRVYLISAITITCIGLPSAAIKWPDDRIPLSLITVLTVLIPGLLCFAFSFTTFFADHMHETTAVYCFVLSIAPTFAACWMRVDQDLHIILSFVLVVYSGVPIFCRLCYKGCIFVFTASFVSYLVAQVAFGIPRKVYDYFGFSIPMVIAIFIFGIFARKTENYLRDNFIFSKKMEKDNSKLKHELHRLSLKSKMPDQKMDLDSGLEKILIMLGDLATTLNPEQTEIIDKIIQTLRSGNNIFAPNLSSQLNQGTAQIDQETQSWLFYELASKDKNRLSVTQESYSSGLLPNAVTPVSAMTGEQFQLSKLLSGSGPLMWNLDVFHINTLTGGKPLQSCVMHLFAKHGFMSTFGIDEGKLRKFLARIESGYLNNPFHNHVHACDVLMNIYFLLSSCPFSAHMTDLELFTAIMAATVHDFDHPGVNNAFQINTESPKALIYNDRSVLENHHAAASFMLMRKDEFNILTNMDPQQRREFRDLAIEMILATDMAMHFEILGQFRSKLSSGGFDFEKKADRIMLLRTAIKCADIAHTSKVPFLHFEWTDRIQTEFYRQGDEEKRLGLAISPFMDREKASIAKSQIGFLDFVVGPLFETWGSFCREHEFMRETLYSNHAEWKRRAQAQGTA